jgi:hypothetical protein
MDKLICELYLAILLRGYRYYQQAGKIRYYRSRSLYRNAYDSMLNSIWPSKYIMKGIQ